MAQVLNIESVQPEQLHDLRRRVLRSNNPDISVIDPRDGDATARHYAGLVENRIVVAASFFPSPFAMNEELVTFQLRYMATDFDVQGSGYGAKVLSYAEDDLRSRGVQQLWANGRDSALGFYKRIGWLLVEGSEHLSPETNIPHTVIYKVLT
jgi:GNAT superfamily N-acetyltransferase